MAPTPFGQTGLFGGGERYPLELARALAERVDCELITFGPHTRTVREPGGLTIRTLRALGNMSGHPAHPVALALPPVIAASRAAIVHTHHMRSLPSRVAALTAMALGKHPVVTDHGLQGGDWSGRLQHVFERFLAVSSYSARELRSPPKKTRIIYGGADPGRYKPDESIARHGVLFVGRITPHKGVDCLIRALPDGAHLRVAGSVGHDPGLPERDYPAMLRKLAEGRDINFLGPVPDSRLPLLFRSAEVFVLPSVNRTCYGRDIRVSELLGLVALEAMASGTPVICSRLGGLPETVQQGVTGFLVEPGNIDELRERVSELLGDPERARGLGRNARDLVLERFTWQACAERCLSAYSEIMNESGS